MNLTVSVEYNTLDGSVEWAFAVDNPNVESALEVDSAFVDAIDVLANRFADVADIFKDGVSVE